MTAEVELLRRLRPSADGPDPQLAERERNALMAVIERRTTAGAEAIPAPRRRRARWVIPAAIAILGVTAAAGWAVLRTDHTISTEIGCPHAIIDATSGDPVADCAELWVLREHTHPPQLAGFVNPAGGIEVVPADQPVPDGWEPLEDGFRQDDRLIALEAELDDWSRGLPSDCFARDDAVELVERNLARLGLIEWSVTTERGAADGRATCSAYYRDGTETRVVVIPLERTGGYEHRNFVVLADRLSSLMVGDDAACLTVDVAAELARAEAARLGFDLATGEIVFHVVAAPADDPRPTCARPTTNVGGRVEITLRAVPGRR